MVEAMISDGGEQLECGCVVLLRYIYIPYAHLATLYYDIISVRLCVLHKYEHRIVRTSTDFAHTMITTQRNKSEIRETPPIGVAGLLR